jgi:hypothetical protein
MPTFKQSHPCIVKMLFSANRHVRLQRISIQPTSFCLSILIVKENPGSIILTEEITFMSVDFYAQIMIDNNFGGM